MQIRLFACLAGGFLGLAIASEFRGTLGLSPTLTFLACASIGVAVGYVVSILFDVFTMTTGDK